MAALTAVAAMAPAAWGGPIVPPGNSAVNQYTQTIPTSGGNSRVRRNGIHSPSQALGKKAARELRQQGADGQAAAELAAAGSPAVVVTGADGSNSSRIGGRGAGPDGGRGTQSGGAGAGGQGGPAAGIEVADEGKSGVRRVLGEMTGASSGDLGLLLPLAILATLLWCGAYFWRRRRIA